MANGIIDRHARWSIFFCHAADAPGNVAIYSIKVRRFIFLLLFSNTWMYFTALRLFMFFVYSDYWLHAPPRARAHLRATSKLENAVSLKARIIYTRAEFPAKDIHVYMALCRSPRHHASAYYHCFCTVSARDEEQFHATYVALRRVFRCSTI